MPKVEGVIQILKDMQDKFKKSQDYNGYEPLRRLHEPHKKKKLGYFSNQTRGNAALDSYITKETQRADVNSNVLIVVRTLKLKQDL